MLPRLVRYSALCAVLLFGSADLVDASPILHTSGAFARDGIQVDRKHAASFPRTTQLWESWQGDDSLIGSLEYGPFTPGETLELYVAGFPNTPGVLLGLRSDRDGTVLKLQPAVLPGPHWNRARWRLPEGWAGTPCHLIAEDNASGGGSWVGVSAPLEPSWQLGKASAESLLQLAIYFLLLIPGFALAVWRGGTSSGKSLILTLCGSGLAAYLAFFVYFLSPSVGPIFSWLIYAGAIAFVICGHARSLRMLARSDYFLPVVLGASVSLLYFSGGFLYGGIESPEAASLSRFRPYMPPDPLLPYWLADTVARGAPLRPFLADWLTSDRPPLQAGLYLLVRPFSPPRYDFEAVGVAAQSWVWIALWVFLRQLKLPRRSIAIILACAVFSGMFFLNSFFCWPKLLPTAFLLLAASLLWSGDAAPGVWPSVWAASCVALAMLGHGGSVFGVVGLGVAYLVDRRKINLSFILLGAATVLIVMTPWILYQKFADPPGDRLVKYHMAGREAIDPRPSFVIIREAYSELSWSQIVRNKLKNFSTLLTEDDLTPLPAVRNYLEDRQKEPAAKKDFNELRYALRSAQFVHYLQSLGLAVLGLFGLARVWIDHNKLVERNAASLLISLFSFSTIAWCLMMFKGGSTSIHQSSYFIGACLFSCAGLGLSQFPRWLGNLTLATNILYFFWLWMTAPVTADSNVLRASACLGFAVVVTASTVATMAILFLISRSERSGSACTSPGPSQFT